MFAKLKPTSSGISTSSNSLLDLNPISQYFEVGKLVGTAGPELVWKIYDATRKTDRKVNNFVPKEKTIFTRLVN